MKLGCIGDDFTGSSDLANTLAKGGMKTVQYSGVPTTPAATDVDAGVVALKTRSLAPVDAVAQSLAALEWLLEQGCEQIFQKYCSTFDSTPEGNIGPVADALAERLGARKVVVCPAFPETGRSIYLGHLFVKDKLLNESGMQNHPLTPMTDPDLRRWLALQTRNDVGHVAVTDVFAGADAISTALDREDKTGKRLIVVDAIRNTDLYEIGKAVHDLKLVTGGSGVALGLPANFGFTAGPVAWKPQTGKVVALSGSCSITTRAQVARHGQAYPTREIRPDDVIEGRLSASDIATWLLASDGIPLAYSSADPEAVSRVQTKFGRDTAAAALEAFFAEIARLVIAGGVTRLISAGGETSGAIIEALNLSELALGPEIDPGVPALRARPALVVALKSGNFGAEDFFEKAAVVLGGDR